MPQAVFDAPVKLGEGTVWITESKSRRGMYHTTLHTTEGKWHCTCEGWRYRYNCKHVNQLKEEQGEDDDIQVSL